MLGSGGSLVADASGNLINPDPRTWIYVDKTGISFETLSNGNTPITALQNSFVADLCALEPGESYTLRFGVATTAISQPAGYSLYSSSDSAEGNLTLLDVKVSTNYQENPVHTIKFKVPDNAVNPHLIFVMMGVRHCIVYSAYGISLEATGGTTGILNSIKEGFSKLWEWLQGIWDSIKEIPTKIGQFITALGDRIKTFFTDLVNNMRNFFTSLGDRISGFFNDIWEKIKSFFLPHDGYFDEYSAKFNAFIDEHFGFLAQLPDELSLIINTLVNYTPADPPYIDFPTVKVPIPGHEFTLIQGQKYVFTILTQSPYNMLYSAYQGFVWLAYCLMLFNFLKHKYNVIFGGDGSAD